jgi:TonB family protein
MRGVSGVLVGRFPILWAILILLPAGLAGCALLGGRRAEPPPPPPPAPPVVVPTPIQMQWEEAPRLLQMVTPIYPDSARRAGIDGQVNLRITVDEQGFVTDAEVVSARPAGLFEEAAVSAILQWVFEPARSGGHPITVQMGQQINFSLKDVRPPPPPPPSGEKPSIIIREMEPPHVPKPGEPPIFMAWETAPILIEALDPVYPDSARRAGLEGMVILQIVIDAQGKVIDARVVLAQPPGVFEEAALEAVRKWRFEPALQREKPIKVQMAQTVMFRLNQKPPPPPPPPPGV